MRLIIRKWDSVISIVLFIYNILDEYNGQKTLKLNHLIQAAKYFEKNETAIRMALSRMVKLGILKIQKANNATNYYVTEEGLQSIGEWREGVKSFFQRNRLRFEKWEGKWHFLALADFARSKEESRVIQEELSELGMRELIKDLWVSPYPFTEKVTSLLGPNQKYFEIIGNIEGMMGGVKLEDVFMLEAARKKYTHFITLASEIQKRIPEIKDNGEYLPLLFQLGWNFFEAASLDPVLPQELIKEWEGDTAVRLMGELRGFLFQRAADYFEELLNI